jgi:uncharacterized protein YneF (UPF0154 family)
MNFINQAEPLLRVFWYIAIPVSVLFLVQTIMTFIGSDSHDGTTANFNGDLDSGSGHTPVQLFSLRNLINFLLGLGWSGISFYSIISNKVLLITVSLLTGLLFVGMFFVIIKQMMRLQENNSFNIKNALNKTGQVYLTIPGHKKGKGKVQVSVNGAIQELDAFTEDGLLPNGAVVIITEILDASSVLVKKYKL